MLTREEISLRPAAVKVDLKAQGQFESQPIFAALHSISNNENGVLKINDLSCHVTHVIHTTIVMAVPGI